MRTHRFTSTYCSLLTAASPPAREDQGHVQFRGRQEHQYVEFECTAQPGRRRDRELFLSDEARSSTASGTATAHRRRSTPASP